MLASYVQRPAPMLIPPLQERDRVANLLGVNVGDVTATLWMYAALDPDSHATGDVRKREAELWEQYGDNRLDLMLQADEIAEERRSVPHYLS